MGMTPDDELRQTPVLRAAIARLCRPPVNRGSLLAGFCLGAWLPLTAPALSLGELSVESRLGQPLAASLPIRLAPGETLTADCVTQSFTRNDLTPVPGLRVRAPQVSQPGSYQLQLSSPRALTEPLYGIELRVACPGTPTMLRQFVLMLDPPVIAPGMPVTAPAALSAPQPGVTPQPATTQAPAASPAARAARATSAVQRPRDPINAGSVYRVTGGDTLSGIAQRVSGRNGLSLWQMAELIFAANPQAFIAGNPDRLRLGSELVIPQPGQPAAASRITPPAPTPVPLELPRRMAVPVVTLERPVARPAQQVTAPPSTAPVDAATVPAPTPVAVAATAPAQIELPPRRGMNPLLATGVGLLLGLVLSLLLGRFGPGGRRRVAVAVAVAERQHAPRPQRVPPADHGIEVTESALPVIPAAMVTAATPGTETEEDITDELSALFGGEEGDTRALPQVEDHEDTADLPAAASAPLAADEGDADADESLAMDETLAMTDIGPGPDEDKLRSAPLEEPTVENPLLTARDLAPGTSFATDSLEDELPAIDDAAIEASGIDDAAIESSGVDWPLEETLQQEALQEPAAFNETPPVAPELPELDASNTSLDLQSLAASADSDASLSDSLIEALRLLEQDYQQELTSTQLAVDAAGADLGGEPMAAGEEATEDTVEQPVGSSDNSPEAESGAPATRRKLAS